MKRLLLCCLLSLILLPAAVLPAGAVQAEEENPLSFRMTATLVKGAADAGFFSAPSTSGQPLARLQKKEQCEVIGQEGTFYHVSYQGHTGYIAKSRLTLSGEMREDPLPEEFLSDVGLEDYIPKRTNIDHLILTGTIRASKPLDTLYAYIWDQRQARVEKAFIFSLDTPSDTIDAAKLKRFLPSDGLVGGRKTLVIQGSSNGELTVLYRTLFYLRGAFKEAASVTDLCKVSAAAVLDFDIKTAWAPTDKHPALTVQIPTGAHASLLTMEWKVPPASFTVELYNDANQLISSETKSTGFYADWVGLTEDVREVRILPTGPKCAMLTLRVYPESFHESAVQRWENVPDKVDMLVISTHQDDELLFLGGAIPYYCARGADVAVAYLTNCGRDRYREALDGLWSAGLRYHPIFLGWSDTYIMKNIDYAFRVWEQHDPYGSIVRLIRRYRPDVIVTQDFNGEYGHSQHQMAVKLVAEALEMANDPNYDPDSVAQYGTWNVKKTYMHLYEENQIVMDWQQPLDDSGVVTPMFLAREAYDKHRSQQAAFSMIDNFAIYHGVKYDNRIFGLYRTTVGPDIEKNDFFENIPAP